MKKTALKIFSIVCALSMIPTISVSADTVLYGDANCDGNVDISDVTALQQHIVKMNELSEQGLENCGFFNNVVDVKSLAQVKKYLIKDVEKLQFSYYDDGIYSEYNPFTDYYILNDFSENCHLNADMIYIDIKHQYSKEDRDWSIEELGFDDTEVQSVSQYMGIGRDGLEQKFLRIKLTEDSRENLTRIIEKIDSKARSDEFTPIEYIGMDYMIME